MAYDQILELRRTTEKTARVRERQRNKDWKQPNTEFNQYDKSTTHVLIWLTVL